MSQAEDQAPSAERDQSSAAGAESMRPSGWRRVARLWRRSRVFLPMNSDIEVTRTVVGVPVAIRIRPSFLLLAAAGGAVGATCRYLIVLVAPSWESLSAGTVLANLLGPFLLGVLLHSLAEGTETAKRRTLRLVVGVGFLGAFTSYAELALEVVTVAERGHPLIALGYAIASIVLGAAATWLGIFASHRVRRRYARRRVATP